LIFIDIYYYLLINGAVILDFSCGKNNRFIYLNYKGKWHMKGVSRRGQSANHAAIVVIIIAILIILYILFLPPEDRAALLGEDTNGVVPGAPSGAQSTLFAKNVGRVYPAGNNLVEHTLPSFLVFTVTNANELKKMDSLYVKNSAFTDKNAEVIFFFDPKTMADAKLSFNVRAHSGRLKIMLNDYNLFDGEITENSPAPIMLPKEYLLGKNTLTFSASEPGAAFWRVNDYELQNVLVSAKVTDYTAASSEQHFSISSSEYEKLESAVLEFLPDCPPREGGQVQVLINSRVIYNSYPDCGIQTRIEVSRDFLKDGDNILVANTNSGSFLMDAPKVTTTLKESLQPVFYFNVPQQLMDALYSGQRGLAVTLKFADVDKTKRGNIEINGFKMFFETQDSIVQESIDPQSLMIGSNAVKVVPQSDAIDVTELRIDVI
jgi:hypothetical protein